MNPGVRYLRVQLKQFFQNEIHGIKRFFNRSKHEVVVIGFSMLFLSLNSYRPIWNEWFSNLLYYAFLPILVIMVFLRRNPLDFGLRRGDFRVWGYYTAIVCLIAAPILFATSFSPSFQQYYSSDNFNPIQYSLVNCVSLFASEFFFRGFLLFGLKDKFREGSILVQMIPFFLVHLGKPELETVSTILTGVLFGYIAYRGKSFWPAFIIHLFINIFFVLCVNLL
jgi:membrane protease YdiL (CAAX protease family)